MAPLVLHWDSGFHEQCSTVGSGCKVQKEARQMPLAVFVMCWTVSEFREVGIMWRMETFVETSLLTPSLQMITTWSGFLCSLFIVLRTQVFLFARCPKTLTCCNSVLRFECVTIDWLLIINLTPKRFSSAVSEDSHEADCFVLFFWNWSKWKPRKLNIPTLIPWWCHLA